MAVNKKIAFTSLGLLAAVSSYVLYQTSMKMSDHLMKRSGQPDDNKKTTIDDASLIQIKNQDGETLNGFYYDYQAPITMLILHPYHLEATDMISYVEFFKTKMHANFLLVDIYAHGDSDGNIIGLGGKDQEDLLAWVQYLDTHFDGNIVLFGKEMGANIILNASGKLNKFEQIVAIISDGAYSSVREILGYRLQKDYYIIKFPFVCLMKYWIKKKYNIDIDALNTVELIKENQIPTLFIHTKKDRYVPLKQVFPLYNATRCNKELFVLKDEERLFDLEENKDDDYLALLDQFIKEYIIK